MLETLTMLQRCIPALLKANSKDASCSLCQPTPLVRKRYFGIIEPNNLQKSDFRLLLLNRTQVEAIQWRLVSLQAV